MTDYDNSNIFARILRGEIPCHKIYEDADTIAFMDVMPHSRGHALIVPKAASRNLLDADPAALAATIPIVQKIAKAAVKALGCDGVQIVQFNEPAAGQTVFHLHFHVIPIYEGVHLKPHTGKMEEGSVLSAVAELYKKAL